MANKQDIAPHILVWGESERKDGTFPATAFMFDAKTNEYTYLKRILSLDRRRLRGPSGAKDQFHLAAITQTSAIFQINPA